MRHLDIAEPIFYDGNNIPLEIILPNTPACVVVMRNISKLAHYRPWINSTGGDEVKKYARSGGINGMYAILFLSSSYR